jgi:hypothetical protein
MKKIYYLIALLAVVFTACQKQPVVGPAAYIKAMTLTLAESDYQLLPTSDYPHNTLSFDNTADANTYIPIILNARDPQLGNGSTANVTYTISAPFFKLADSVYKDVAYTLTDADYTLLPGNTFTDFSASQILKWLPYEYPKPVSNQLAVLTFNYYNGTTTVQTFSYLYSGGAWKQIYMISNAQYASVGRSNFNQFTSADDANLIAYLSGILKADIALSATAKYGDMQYVSFNYYVSSTKSTYQRVIPLLYNGSSWVHTASITNTLAYLKSGGTWIADPTVYYTLTANDTKLIGNSSIGAASDRTDLAKYGDFETTWSAADIKSAIILVLTTDFPSPKANVNYNVTYLYYTGGADVPTVLTFQYNGTAWVSK